MKSLILLLIAMSAAGTFPFIIYMALSTILIIIFQPGFDIDV